MLKTDYTSKLLNLEEVKVTDVRITKASVHVYLELPRKVHKCPVCGAESDKIHDYREQIVKDVPFGQTTYLHLRKRRYCCPECGKRFAEENNFVARYHRMTKRLITSIIHAFRKVNSATQIAAEHNVSVTTALRYFDCVSYRRRALPTILSIDEFKGDAGGEKYQTILADPEHKAIIDILPNRFEADLSRYFMQFPSRKQVQYFVSDMNPHFRSVAHTCFPNAICVADKYHVIRQVIWAMENVRKNEQKKLSQKYRIYFKRSKSLLNKPLHKLSEKEMNRLAFMFEISPRLADAYALKNEFLQVMRSESSEDGAENLKEWLKYASSMDIPEFHPCQTAYFNWYQEIINSFDVPWSNGFIEGCNNKTKVLKRVCYGVTNFKRFRSRILHCAS